MNSNFPSRETVARIREQYPAGTRVELISMNDPYTKLMPGDRGNVTSVDATGTIFVAWDSGSGLGVVYGEDSVKKIEREIHYATGKDFWLDTIEHHGLREATGICQRYLGVQLRSSDKSEGQFCHELFAAMVEDTLSKADPTKIVYPYDFATAKDRLEERFYHDSRKLNIDCAESIDAAIRDCCYASNHYNLRGAVRKVVSEYGFERVNRVVARLIQRNDYDGRYSTANKTWAADFAVPEAAFNGAIMNAHPVLLDDFAKYLREMYAELDGARFTLPGQPEFGEKVHDYEIIRSIRFDDNRGFAIGHNTDAVEKFVAWQFTTEKGERDFYWGNYSDSLEVAGQNYSVRVGNHLRDGDAEVIQNPVAAEQTTIRVRLISDEQRESDGAWLKLPATVDDLRAVFEQIGVHGPNGERYIAAEFSSPCKGVAEILSPNDSLDELNMLASYLKDMESWEIDKLQAILTGNVAVGVDSASGLINLLDADTFASFHVIDANTISELGAYWIRELPDDVPEGATAAEYGAQCASEDGGVFTEWGYAYKRYDTSVEYDGVVPQEYRIVDFALLDLPARVDRHEQTNSVKAQLEASRKVPPAPRKKKDDKDGHKSER